MKKFARALTGALVTLCTVQAMAAPIPMDSIVQLSKAGIGDEAIVAKIKSSGTHYDLSVEQMMDLKRQGISGPVLAALMATPSLSEQPMSVTSPDPMVPHPTGVYLAGDGQGQMTRIDATMSNQAKTGGTWGYALTGGIASLSIKAAIQNETARVKASAGQPVFYFFFDESNPQTAGRASSFGAGDASVVSSPGEFSLVHLMKKDGRREARVGSMNIGGAKTGVMDKDRIEFAYQMIRPGVFRVMPKQNLDAGEYGFIYALTGGGGRTGMMTARVFDFSIS
jgi:hypothetical protein